MARIYAGILGPLALLTLLARGLTHGDHAPSILMAAWCGLLVFAPLGYVIGRLAEWLVEDSVRSRISAELAAGPGRSESPAEAADTRGT